MAKPQDVLQSAWSKRKKGVALTKAELEAMREYSRKASRASIPVYFESIEAKKEFLAKAKELNIHNVSAWMREQVGKAIDGNSLDPDDMRRFERDLDQANKKYNDLFAVHAQAIKSHEELAAHNQQLSRQLARLLARIMPDEVAG